MAEVGAIFGTALRFGKLPLAVRGCPSTRSAIEKIDIRSSTLCRGGLASDRDEQESSDTGQDFEVDDLGHGFSRKQKVSGSDWSG
ncbi:hypothetical protein RISK_006306 [Rhodopirellula islandica]|uniref:Uncharacterized protein n=1 Tax=Rhodopirellula islandica TaxID=595434 RepID=A0A0J1B5A4_RHOIS|nr:hypothetical protein RISK_006306 [Rhodopirellula islandica]